MKTRLSIPVALFIFLLITGSASASVSNNQVQSQHIREADGTSGQDTNSGAGVKTGHIQDSAVTSEKIQDGQVQNADLGADAVTGDKILDGTVGNVDLAPGAVTDAKISGVISTAKLPVGIIAGTVAAGDHNHDNLYQKKYANVVVVAKSGGDFTDPIAAINSITGASASNPYLMKIMPGIYDLGSSALFLKDYVDLEGSGENVTLITSSVPGGNYFSGTVNVASNAEVRFLAIANTGGGENAIGLSMDSSSLHASVKLTNLAVSASGGAANFGILFFYSQSTTMTNVTAIGSGGGEAFGVWNAQSSVTMINVVATGTGGTIRNWGVRNQSGSFEMINVVATASGGQESYGITDEAGSLTMTNVAVSASGAGTNYGVQNYMAPTAPIMTNVSVTASGGTNNYGVWNTASYPIMSNVTATATSGILSYGMVNWNCPAGSVLVDRSTLEGTTKSISNCNNCTARIGASKLSGGIIGIGLTCVASYDGDYAPLDASCQ